MVGFLSGLGMGVLQGVDSQQRQVRDQRAEDTKAAMERLDRNITAREAQIETRAQRMQQAQMLAQSRGGDPSEYMAALEAGTPFENMLTGQVRRNTGPATTAQVGGVAGPRPGAPLPTSGGPAPVAGGAPPASPGVVADPRAAADRERYRMESGGRMVPGIVGDGGRAAGPGQVHPAALADVNRAHGTNYTHQQLIDDPVAGKWVADRYMDQMLARTGGDHRLAGAAYNGGIGNLERGGFAGMSPAAQRYGNNLAAAAGGAPQGNPANAATSQEPAQEPASARPPVDMSGIPPNPDVTPRGAPGRADPVLGPQARAVMDRLFGRVDPARVQSDARGRLASIRGMSVDQLAELERPLPRASFNGGPGFTMDALSPQDAARLQAQQDGRERVATIAADATRDGARIRKGDGAPARTTADYTAMGKELERQWDGQPNSVLRRIPNPNSPGEFVTVPRGVPNDASAAELNRLNRAREIYPSIARAHPELAPAEIIAQAIRLANTPRTPAPTPPPVAPAQQPTAREDTGQPIKVRNREEALTYPPGTLVETPDGRQVRVPARR